MKETIKLLAVNLVLLGFLVTLANLLSIAGIEFFNGSKPKQYAQSHLFPNYRGVPWAHQHFTEYDNLTKGYYRAFYGWRRPAYHGETINIDDQGLRTTWQSGAAQPGRTIAFFGGSTTWGTGADDATTIPSWFVKQNPDYSALNFGETGYVAHQSLNLFMERYFSGYRPSVVVFYDGVNDVWNKCRREHDAFSHSREHQIRTLLQEHAEPSYMDVVAPVRDLVGRVQRTLASRGKAAAGSRYDCAEDAAKAQAVARVLLSDWLVVKHLVEGYGGTFVAILQPEAYGSTTPLDHLDLDPALGRQYEAVYPRIVELIGSEFAELGDNFLDLRTALDQDDYVYIDWCHLSPNGNQIIAQRIGDAVAARAPIGTARAQN
jgi:lysophospholipase L1-like esterase